jgi:hypothetical protein
MATLKTGTRSLLQMKSLTPKRLNKTRRKLAVQLNRERRIFGAKATRYKYATR